VAWSTSELAKLAGTTVNTIRHYHRSGVLEEPDRRRNGYKQYECRTSSACCASGGWSSWACR
jgi:hypothetical protein